MALCSYGGIRPPLHLHSRIHCVPLDSRRRCALDNEVPALLRLLCSNSTEYLFAIRHVLWLMRTQVEITVVRRAVTKTCSVGRRVDHRRTSQSPSLVTVFIIVALTLNVHARRRRPPAVRALPMRPKGSRTFSCFFVWMDPEPSDPAGPATCCPSCLLGPDEEGDVAAVQKGGDEGIESRDGGWGMRIPMSEGNPRTHPPPPHRTHYCLCLHESSPPAPPNPRSGDAFRWECGCSAYERAPASVGVGGKPLQLPRGCLAPHPDLSPSTGTWLSSGWPAG
ncbi:hypothetical protein B296_00007546 [Ensete ventricosum]|uniref:Uncharacterized protein n=1 Tax=Ensete ventricosum TaxID=4639 RepID=A0A426YC18_ENSVE|nr:hypothetical protein B296_00007546 [Ensete ventricosum]